MSDFERFMLVARGVHSAHQSLRMLRSTGPSVDIERDIVSKSCAGMPGWYFFLVKSHRPLWNFRTSICLLREIL